VVKNQNEVRGVRPEKIPTTYAVQGTSIWGFNKFKQDALVKLMLDLHQLEYDGLNDEQNQIITDALEKISISLSEIPDDFLFRSSIMSAFDKFKDEYIAWTEVKGSDWEALRKRREIMEKMKKRRHKLAAITRKNQYILSENLDLKLIENIYEALGSIPNALPDLFRNLGSAVNNFLQKDKTVKK